MSIEIHAPDTSRGQTFLRFESDPFTNWFWGHDFNGERLLFGPYDEVLTDLSFLKTTFQPGYIWTQPGTGFHDCEHLNVKGAIRVNLPAADMSKTAVYFSGENTVEARYEDITQQLRCFYAQDVVGRRLYAGRTYASMPEIWSLTGHFDGSGGTMVVRYSHCYSSGRENDGNEMKYEFSSLTPLGGGRYTATMHRMQRSHVGGGREPIPWGEWREVGTREVTLSSFTVAPDVPLVGLAFARNALDIRVALAVRECLSAANRADLSACFSDCADQVPLVDVNQIENLKDAADVSALFPWKDAVALARNYDSPKQWVKSGSSFYLWYHYAVKPTVSDVRELLAAKRTQAAQTAARYRYSSDKVFRAARQEHHGRAATNIWCRFSIHPTVNDAVAATLTQLDDWGLMLNASRAWDCVPFSFVVDWFVGTNYIMSSLDSMCRSYRYTTNYVDTTVKTVVDFTDDVRDVSDLFEIDRPFTASYYSRHRGAGFPPLTLRPKSDWSRHSFEGAALILGSG